jgi:hypothetical protein
MGFVKTNAETSSKQRLSPLAVLAVREPLLLLQSRLPSLALLGQYGHLVPRKTWNEIQEGI